MRAEAQEPSGTDTPLLPRLGFDLALEADGFRLLGEMDLDGCREAFARLVGRLDLTGLGPRRREAVLLLLDILQKIEGRVHRDAADREAYAAARSDLLREFAALEDPEAARVVFLASLGRLLLPLRHPSPTARSLVLRARALIDQHYRERVSLSCVAGKLNVSPNHLSRAFRQQTGMTLTEFVHQTRLEHARLLLAEGGRTICEIAYLVGYQNYRDFYRNFTKHERASPREVRRRGTAGL